jgi:putative component of toxin-antitoxin plasmid stabilization module
MSQGNLSNVKGVGEGVLEFRIDWGPGYRIYIGRDGEELIFAAGRRHKEGPAGRYRPRQGMLEGLTKTEDAGVVSLCL